MIKIENVEVHGWEPAIRGMRNPKNSWERSDSVYYSGGAMDLPYDAKGRLCNPAPGSIEFDDIAIGPNDQKLMTNLANGGPVHAKYRRMITVYVDITAPLYWWKEFDTYKVGTVANSCSTMHKIHEKEFTIEDFSCEQLLILGINADFEDLPIYDNERWSPHLLLGMVIKSLNWYRDKYLETKDKKYWWQMIQLLPSSYNQKRTVMLNYEVLASIYKWRKNHKLDEWVEFCKWIESLPYSEIITGVSKEDE